MAVTISGTDGITTPGLTNTGTETLVNLTTTGNTTLGDASTDTLNVGNGGLIKDASGNVGVGVTPSAWGGALSAGMDFKFSGGIASHNSANAFYLVSNGYYNSSGVWKYRQNGYANYVNVGNGDGSIAFYTAASGTAGNSISFTQAMTLDASGRLLVGTTSNSSSARFKVVGDGTYVTSEFNQPSTGSYTSIIFTNPNGTVGSITTNGSATTYATSSDYRLKNTIAPMTGALAKVLSLKPVAYKWNADDSDGQGFIAHELAEVCPDAVVGEKDAVDADGNPKYQGIDTSFLVATLTAAIQEQSALITTLTARITALEAK